MNFQLLYQSLLLFLITLWSTLEDSRVSAKRIAFVSSCRCLRQTLRGPIVERNVARSTTDSSDHTPTTTFTPLADVPLKRLQLPKRAVGREYVIVPLKIQDQGPFDFMIDTGLTAELVTPHLVKLLGMNIEKQKSNIAMQGLAAGGTTSAQDMIRLDGVSLCSSDCDHTNELKLPTLHAFVKDFSQEHMDPKHDPVEGMLGMEVLELFDVDFDFPAGRLRFWAPGTGAAVAQQEGMVEIPGGEINESLLRGIRVAPAVPADKINTTPQQQPFMGIIDCGSSFSAVNWAAARLLGLPPKSNKLAYMTSPVIMGVGVDDKPLPLPTKKVQLTFCGEAKANENGVLVKFEPPPSRWRPWEPVMVGIGDLPAFELLLGEEDKPFHGPAAIIGMDILSQRRFIMETCRGTLQCSEKRRRMYVSSE